MVFRQLFEPLTSTYTYLLGCPTSGEAVMIDPVVTCVERDLQVLRETGLRLVATLETHIHADHITGARLLKERTGCANAVAAAEHLPCADWPLEDGKVVHVGGLAIEPIHTPGHTDTHLSFLVGDRVFTGDALLIDGCGRTDFQGGDARALFRSITGRLYTLPDDTLVFPGHDYHRRRVSTIAQEKARNPRVPEGQTEDAFADLMARLALPPPAFIAYAVPGNRDCGVQPAQLPEALRAWADPMQTSAGVPHG